MKIKQLADLNRRLFVATLSGCIVTGLIAFSAYPVVSFALMLVVASLAGIGVWEYAQFAKAKEFAFSPFWMVVFAVLQVGSFYCSLIFVDFPELPVFVLAGAMIFLFIRNFQETEDALSNIAVQFFGICYVAVPLSFLLGVLYPFAHAGSIQEGKWWLAYLIVTTKVTDVGAYFVGRLFGKHPLARLLSPKKTVEGALAGLVCAVLFSVGRCYVGREFSHGTFDLNLTEAVILGVLIGIFGQMGDLAESLLKRDAVVKDSNTLPGLGGVLDMVDSLLFTTPILYFFLRVH